MAEHHPLGDIEYLRETLLKSYRSGFPILKELIQNAEDANSTHLDYGWVEGISDAEHPLLRLPALFFVNNGDFTDNNAKSIRYIIGASSKPNQEGAIGKFGLGLKSIFHLCEAFFYLAPDVKNSNYERCSIFNPWADARSGKDEFHEGWDNFSKQDQSKIGECLRQILAKKAYEDKRFILWIPLRQPEPKTFQDEDKDEGIELGYIVRDFFQDVPTFLSENNIEHKIGSLLVLLHSLSNICYWERNNKKFHISLSDAKRQCFSVIQENRENSLKGTITLNQKKLFEYSGHEIVFSTQLFQDILISPDLPRKFKTIKPHSGVIFSTTHRSSYQSETKSESYLSIRTAVFLPIGEDKNILCKSKNDYSLILHGYFFVDSGRTGILGIDQKELIFTPFSSNDSKDDLLKKDWNLRLYDNLLSRLLYGIDKFVSELNICDFELTSICTALLESNLFKQNSNRKTICKEKQWIYRVRPNAIEWILLDAKERVLSVPEPQQEGYTAIWKVFSGLANIAKTTCLSLSGKPNLRASRKMDDWSENEIREILQSVKAEKVFGDRVYISYLVSLLKGCDSNCIRGVQKDLCLLAKQAFRLEPDKLRPQSSVQSFINLIDSERRFSIDCNDQLIQNEVYKLDLQVLIVPKFDLAKNDTQLGYGDAKKLIECIARIQLHQSNSHTIVNFTKQVLKAASQHITQIIDSNSCLNFIVAYDCRARQFKFFSPDRLKAVRQLKTLFKVSQCNELTTALQEALPSNIIVLIERDIADLLYGKNSIMPCEQQTCLGVLESCPKLSPPEQRLNLLKRLLQNV